MGELDRAEVGVGRARDVGELTRLRRHRVADLRPAVPDIHDVETRKPVEIRPPLGICQLASRAADDDPQAIAFRQVRPALLVYTHIIYRLFFFCELSRGSLSLPRLIYNLCS